MLKSVKLTRKMVTIFLLAMTAMMFTSAAMSVESLRGDSALDNNANKAMKFKVKTQQGGFQRSFDLQPPMVPHKVDKYTVTLKNNGCLKCHSKKSHKKEKAPMVGESHFKTRDGKVLEKISSRRYFCSQCHAPQIDGAPLVENTHTDGK